MVFLAFQKQAKKGGENTIYQLDRLLNDLEKDNTQLLADLQSYEVIINAEDNKIDGQIFNVGYDNKSVKEIAKIVKSELGDDIKFLTEKTNDNRSYHISSHKIQKTLGFSPDFNINDAAKDLKIAFDEKKLKNPLNNEFYFNIKRMQSINLK